jgi:peptidoglycan/LPS O-acetylase OafA/YrhL
VSRRRLEWVNAVRGIAILLVMAVHTSQHVGHLSAWSIDFFACGAYGVQLFFIASAFTILRSWRSRSGEPHAVLRFFTRRFFRIAPLFYVGIAFYGALRVAQTGSIDPAGVAVTALFLHSFSPPFVNYAVPGGWSIGAEWAFYALVPVLAVVATNLRRSVFLFAATMAFALAARWVLAKTGGDPSSEFGTFWLPNQLPAFALGFVLYWAVELDVTLSRWVAVLGALGTVGVFAASQIIPMARLLSCVLLFFVCLSLSSFQWPLLVNRFTKGVGIVSFSCYLWHFAVLEFFSHLWRFEGPAGMALLYAMTVVGTVVISAASYKLIEVPGQALGDRLVKGLQKPNPATS